MPRVLIPIVDGCEELEAVTLIDVLRRGRVEVVVAGLEGAQVVSASRGVRLVPDVALSEVLDSHFDLVLLPGGLPGAQYLDGDDRIRQLLQRTHAAGGWVGAICAAPMVLRSAGLLDGRQATSYPGVLDKSPAPGMTYTGAAVTQDGRVLTSRGPGTAMAFALHLLGVLQGEMVQQEVARGLVQ